MILLNKCSRVNSNLLFIKRGKVLLMCSLNFLSDKPELYLLFEFVKIKLCCIFVQFCSQACADSYLVRSVEVHQCPSSNKPPTSANHRSKISAPPLLLAATAAGVNRVCVQVQQR
ncbi:unnamed protein product [Citrullus colocynthis]|uniref:Uncharacterized protein n=1 Tax=Citrullus colocynthis TaxID=252529 RepID=A0ABP0ZBD3_9ROSI